jgi:phage regulator Rha-like protein
VAAAAQLQFRGRHSAAEWYAVVLTSIISMPKKAQEMAVMPLEFVERKIFLIRGRKVMIDADLAEMYGVPTKSLNLAVRRNKERFPEDFMFQLTKEEAQSLRFQIETSKTGRGGRRYLPYAFTEHGVAMLSAVLNSQRAIGMSIVIIRVFVRLREILATHQDLGRAIDEIRRRQEEQGEQITAIIQTINQLLAPEPVRPKRRIGFTSGGDAVKEQ